MRIIGNILSI